MASWPISAAVKDVQFFFSGYKIADGEDGPSVLLCRENRGRGRPAEVDFERGGCQYKVAVCVKRLADLF